MWLRHAEIEPLDFAGLAIRDYTSGTALESSLATIEVPPGVRHARAWSKRSDKYYLVLAGEIEFSLEDETRRLARRDFCLVPRGRRFSYRNPTSHSAELLLIHTPSFDLDSEVFEEPE